MIRPELALAAVAAVAPALQNAQPQGEVADAAKPEAAVPRASAAISEDDAGAKLTIKPVSGATLPPAAAQLAGGVLIVRFDAPVDLDLSALPIAAPRSIANAAATDDKKAFRLSLRRALQASLSQSAEAVVVSLASTDAPAAARAEAPAVAAPANAELSIGVRPDLTRLTFSFSGSSASVSVARPSPGEATLRFSRPAEIDISDLRVSPPRLIRGAQRLSRPGERLAIALSVEPGARVRQFVESGRVVVDVLPPEPGAPVALPTPMAAAEIPKPKAGAAQAGPSSVRMSETPEETTFAVTWPNARAAAFRRGDAVYLMFDGDPPLDLRVGRRNDIQLVRGEGVTGLRYEAPRGARLSLRREGDAWIMTAGRRAPAMQAAPVRRDVGVGGQGRVIVGLERDGVVRTFTDPVVGDKIAVALVGGDPVGVEGRRSTPFAALLESAHGAAAELKSDDVDAAMAEGEFIVAPKVELADLDSAVAGLEAIPLLDVRREAAVPQHEVLTQRDELSRRAAAEGFAPNARAEARLALARFLIAHELSAEALGALRLAAANRSELELDPKYRLMRGVANVMMGRHKEARLDLEAGALTEDPAAALWRGYLAAEDADWPQARAELERGRADIDTQPKGWRGRFELALAHALVELRQLEEATAAAERAVGQGPLEVAAEAKIVRAKIAAARGDPKAALAALKELETSRIERVAVRASFESVRIERAMGLAQAEAIEKLEQLRLRWRGDALELAVIQQLGGLYAENGRWREALMVLRGGATRHAEEALGRAMRIDMAALFERLFLDGEADKLQPVQALGLFYDFKELTPVGANGDRMVRNLAGRLVALDLLEQAAELLQHQVDERLQGLARAQIASDLAMIYLQDRKPDRALLALAASRQANLPQSLVADRRILEARALLDLKRFEHAEEVLERDQSPEAQRIRADAAWRARDWPKAAAQLRRLLDTRPASEAFDQDARNVAIRAAIAHLFAADQAGLSKLKADYWDKMAGSVEADAFELVATDPRAENAQLQNLARAVARTDLLGRFVDRLKKDMIPAATPASPPA